MLHILQPYLQFVANAGSAFHVVVTLPSPHSELAASVSLLPPSYTASSSLVTAATAINSAAAVTPPVYSSASTLITSAASVAGSATATTPVYAASGSLMTPATAVAAAVIAETPEYTATSELTTSATELNASVIAETPEYTATVELTQAVAALTASISTTSPEFDAAAELASASSVLVASASLTSPVYAATASLAAVATVATGEVASTTPVMTAAASLTSTALAVTADCFSTQPGRTAEASLWPGSGTVEAIVASQPPTTTATASLTAGTSLITVSVAFSVPTRAADAGIAAAASQLAAIVTFAQPTFAATVALLTTASIVSADCSYLFDDQYSLSEGGDCGTTVTTTYGRQRIAVNQPGAGGSNYPFSRESSLSDLIADLYLYYRNDKGLKPLERCLYTRPFQIAWLYGFGCQKANVEGVDPVHDFEMAINDAEGRPVFDSREASEYSVVSWGNHLQVIQWKTEEAILRVVRFLGWNEDETPRNWPIYFEPSESRLDDRTLEEELPRVRSIRPELGNKLTAGITFAGGYNAEWFVTNSTFQSPGRATTTIQLDVSPGLGDGKYGDCTDPEFVDETVGAIRRINNISGDPSGNFTIDATDCYRLERPVIKQQAGKITKATVRNHTLKLSNDCGPCCECQDFINTYEGIRRVRDRYADLFQRALRARDTYVKNRQRFLDSADCRVKDPLRVVVRPICPGELGVAVGFCNNSSDCLRNLVLPISFEFNGDDDSCTAATVYSGDDKPQIVCNTTFRAGNREENPLSGNPGGKFDYYQLGGTYPHYYAYWERVDPGGLAQVTFRIKFQDSQPGDFAEIAVDAYRVDSPAAASLFGKTTQIPIPGYTAGTGFSGSSSGALRLVESCKVVRSGIFDEDCCGETSFSEVVSI